MPSQIPWASGELQKLVSDPESCIYRESRKLSLVLQPFQLQDLKSAVHEILRGSIDRYDNTLEGIILDYQHLKILSNSGNVAAETSGVVLDIQADFYIFRPEVGSVLKGVVNKISKDHVGVLLYQRFNVSCPRPRTEEHSLDWLGNNVKMYQEVTLKLKEKSYMGRLPYFRGKLTSCGKILNATDDGPIEVSKKSKKSKKALEEAEITSLSSPVVGKVSTKTKELQVDTSFVKEHSKKRKLLDSMSEALPKSVEVLSPKLKKKRVSIAPFDEGSDKELPLKSDLLSPRQSKKKRVSLASSVDEVDFIPKMPMDEHFLSQSILPDQFPSPSANSTYFDVGKILSSQRKKTKKDVGGLSDIREELTDRNSVISTALKSVHEEQPSEVTPGKKKKKNTKTDMVSALSSTLHEEQNVELKDKKSQKKEKKRKAQDSDSTSSMLADQQKSNSKIPKTSGIEAMKVIHSKPTSDELIGHEKDSSNLMKKSSKKDRKKKSSDDTDSMSLLTSSPSQNATECKEKSDKKQKKKVQDGLCLTSEFSARILDSETQIPQPSKKHKDKTSQMSDSVLNEDVFNTKQNIALEPKEKSIKKDKKKKSDDAGSAHTLPKMESRKIPNISAEEKRRANQANLKPTLSQTELNQDDKNMGNFDEPEASTIKKPKKKSKVKHDSQPAQPKLNFKTNPGVSEDERNILASFLQNLDKNLASVNEELRPPNKKKNKIEALLDSSSSVLSAKTKKTEAPPRETVRKSPTSKPNVKKPKSTKEPTSESKKIGEELPRSDDDFVSDDIIPPGQRVRSGSPQKSDLLSRSSSFGKPSNVSYFPGNSVAGLDFGIKPGLRATPLVFGDIQGDIPPPEAESSSDCSDSHSNQRMMTAKAKSPSKLGPVVGSPVKSSVPPRATPSSSSSDSESFESKSYSHPKQLNTPKKSGNFKFMNTSTVSPISSRLGVASPERGFMLTKKSPSKLDVASGTPQKLPPSKNLPLNSDSDTPSKRNIASGLLSPVKNLKSPVKILSPRSIPHLSSSSPPPKKLIVSGLHSDSDDSTEEVVKGSKQTKGRSKSETSSSDSEYEKGSKEVTNRFLQSMGVIQSPLKAAQLVDHESSDSDSDSSYNVKKVKKLQSFRSDNKTTPKTLASSLVKSPNKALNTNDASRQSSGLKFDSFTSAGKLPGKAAPASNLNKAHEQDKEMSPSPTKKSQSVSAESKSKPQSAQTAKKSGPLVPPHLTDDDSSDSEDDLERMRAAALLLKQNSDKGGAKKTEKPSSKAPKKTPQSVSASSKEKLGLLKSDQSTIKSVKSAKKLVQPSHNNVADNNSSDSEDDLERMRAAALALKQKETKGTSPKLHKKSQSKAALSKGKVQPPQSDPIAKKSVKSAHSSGKSAKKPGPQSHANETGDDTSDSDNDLERMRAAALALEHKKPENVSAKKGGKQPKPLKKAQPMAKAKLETAPTKVKEKPSGTYNNHGSDSDSGPDDRNTTQILEKRRLSQTRSKTKRKAKKAKALEAVSKPVQYHDAKALKTDLKSTPKASKRVKETSTFSGIKLGSTESAVEAGTSKAVKGKGKTKKGSNTDDEVKDIFRRLMQQAQLDLNIK